MPPLRSLPRLAAVAGLGLLAGCTATVTSWDATRPDSYPERQKKVSGLYYYVPQGFIEIAGRIEPADRDAKDNLPSVRKGDFTVTVSVDLQPDRAARFFFRPSQDMLSDVSTRQVVNQKGLLDTVTSATLVDPAPAALAIAQMAPITVDLGPAGEDGAHAPFYYRFDPFDRSLAAAVRRDLEEKQGLRVAFTPPLDPGKNPSAPEVYAAAEKYPGVLFRPVVPITVAIRPVGTSSLQGREVTVCVPDKRALQVFDLTRAFFVNRTAELQFRDGVLVSAAVGKPGLVTSIISIPLTLIKSVFL